MVFSWWRKLVKDMSKASPSRRRPARAPRSYRPWLEWFEDRLAPATHIWQGAAGANWSVAGNWNGGVPTTGEAGGTIVQFPGTGGATSVDNISGLVVDQIHFTGDGNTISGTTALGISGATLSTNLQNDAGTNTLDSSLAIALSGGSFRATVTAGQVTIAGTISGNQALVLNSGNGTLVLANSANTYSGGTTINSGTLSVAADGDLGVATGSVTINNGATLLVTATFTLGASRTVILGRGSDLIEVFGTLTVAGQVIGTGTLTTSTPAAGVHTLVLANATNSYSGGTTIGNGGFVVVGTDSALGAAAGALTFDGDLSAPAGGPLANQGFLETTASFTTSRAVTLSDGMGFFDADTGTTLTVGGQISGTGTLGVDGTLRLTGNNTYGLTDVFDTLLVNGSQPGSAVDGGTLGGIGTVGAVTVGHLAPGSPPPGILTTGNLTLSAFASFDVTIQGTTAGSGYSQLNVQGTVNLGSSQLSVSTSVVPAAGSTLTIIKNNGASPVAGTFSGLPEGAVFSVNGPAGRASFQITYHGGSGRDVVLTRPSAAITGTASYVVGLYQDLLQRQPDGGGLAFFTGLLNAGTPRTTVVLDFETSVEYRTLVIQNLYRTLLDRAPDPVGFNSFLQFFASGGTLMQAQAFVLGSPEYFALAPQLGGLHPESSGFITAVYRDVLSRLPDPPGMAFFSQFLAGGGTRMQAAQIMLSSLEADQDVVQAIYLHFLRRAADPEGLTTWTNFLQHGATDEQVQTGILASGEYFGR
ncbi:MAG TPA: DUF4214 domain-containing protein [Gemmataceae bacterium]|jgi:autotransporter-associated beta strand protein|nr:DUF4214 domain-containing protein [Gemmataceae bacterium]